MIWYADVMTLTRAQQRKATELYSAWRSDPASVPTLVTSHEAYVLTQGLVGIEGDQSASNGLSLSRVASQVAVLTVKANEVS